MLANLTGNHNCKYINSINSHYIIFPMALCLYLSTLHFLCLDVPLPPQMYLISLIYYHCFCEND